MLSGKMGRMNDMNIAGAISDIQERWTINGEHFCWTFKLDGDFIIEEACGYYECPDNDELILDPVHYYDATRKYFAIEFLKGNCIKV